MSLVPKEFYYPLCAVLLFGLALALVPKDKFKPLFWYGLVWGFFAGYFFVWIFGTWLKLFEYQFAEPFKVFGVCLWLAFAWIPAIMVYLHFLPLSKLWYAFPLYLLIFALASASLDEVFHQAGLLKYDFWNPFVRFMVAVFWFWGAKIHYLATNKALGNDESGKSAAKNTCHDK